MFGTGFAILCAAMLLFCFIRPDTKAGWWRWAVLDTMCVSSFFLIVGSISVWLYRVMP